MRETRQEVGLHGFFAGALGYASVVVFFAAFSTFAGKSPLDVPAAMGYALFPGLATTAETAIGAALAFLISRYLASDWVADKTGGRLKQLINGVETEGWRFVAFVRLVLLFSFNLLNYALGLTRIRFSYYLLATYICMLPGAFAYTYLGYAGREAVGGSEGLI